MKTRHGYVSNSSSSSFVVILRDEMNNKTSITGDQENLLYGYGFRYASGDWRRVLIDGAELHDAKDGLPDSLPLCMYYDVVCNEDEPESFLFENKIPFVASEHYDMKTVNYDGVHDYYDVYTNAGTGFLMYGLRDGEGNDIMIRQLAKSRPFCRIRLSDDKDITDTLIGD